MDVSDRATQEEENLLAATIEAARRATDPAAAERARLIEAREIAQQHGLDHPDLARFNLSCRNDCGESIDLLSTDEPHLFCSADCLADWQQRQRVMKITGKR